MRENYLLTEGVTSVVCRYRFGDSDAPLRGLGHVALFDWDQLVTPDDARAMSETGELTGPVFVFESSDGSYHGWNPVVRTFNSTATALSLGRDDPKHNDVGMDRGWWRLRYGEKFGEDGETYKSAPEYVEAFVPPGDDPLRVSDPHLELLRIAGVPEGTIEWVRENHHPVGDTAEVVQYCTMTDMEKTLRRRLRGDDGA